MKGVGGGENKVANVRSGRGSCGPTATATSPNRTGRRTGKGSYVDESLFQGAPKCKKGVVARQNDTATTTPTSVAVMSRGKQPQLGNT